MKEIESEREEEAKIVKRRENVRTIDVNTFGETGNVDALAAHIGRQMRFLFIIFYMYFFSQIARIL